MATKYLVEYVLVEGDPGWSEEVQINLFKFGTIDFCPQSDFDGRRVIEVDSQECRDSLLAKNPPGLTVFREPTDLINRDLRRAIRSVVNEVLDEREAAKNVAPAPKAKPKEKAKPKAKVE